MTEQRNNDQQPTERTIQIDATWKAPMQQMMACNPLKEGMITSFIMEMPAFALYIVIAKSTKLEGTVDYVAWRVDCENDTLTINQLRSISLASALHFMAEAQLRLRDQFEGHLV